MSWNVLLVELPPGARSVREVPRDFAPNSLGSRDALIARLQKKLPSIDFTDPTWGTLDGGNYSIQFDMGEELEVDTITLHVEGGEDAERAIQVAAQAIGSRAFDMTRGRLL